MLVVFPLVLFVIYGFDPLFRSDDPFAAKSWEGYRAVFDSAFFMMAFSSSLLVGILIWSIGEELYRYFNNKSFGMDDYDKKQFIESWEPRRQGGRVWFVLRSAFIFFLLVTTVTVLMDLFDFSFSEALSNNLTFRKIAVKLVFGALLGLFNWYQMERQYRAAKGT
jgi:hypothetical protein